MKKLCDQSGIAHENTESQEFARDSRLLIYAAYHDHGRTVNRLLDAGFDESQVRVQHVPGQRATPAGSCVVVGLSCAVFLSTRSWTT